MTFLRHMTPTEMDETDPHRRVANHIDDIVRKYKCWAQHPTYEKGRTTLDIVKRGCYELDCIKVVITDTAITTTVSRMSYMRSITHYLADPDCFQQFEATIVPMLDNMPVEPNF